MDILENSQFTEYMSTLGSDVFDDFNSLKENLPEYKELLKLKKFAFYRMTI